MRVRLPALGCSPAATLVSASCTLAPLALGASNDCKSPDLLGGELGGERLNLIAGGVRSGLASDIYNAIGVTGWPLRATERRLDRARWPAWWARVPERANGAYDAPVSRARYPVRIRRAVVDLSPETETPNIGVSGGKSGHPSPPSLLGYAPSDTHREFSSCPSF